MTRPTASRRRLLASLGVGVAGAFAGCSDVGVDGEPRYEAGEVSDPGADNRTDTEMAAAEALAEQEVNEGVTPLDALAIRDHEYVFEGGYLGSTVQGTVANTGGDRIELVEVRVRVYDDGGNQLGRYLATTGDVDGGGTWSFQVILLEPPSDIASYDVSVLGTPT